MESLDTLVQTGLSRRLTEHAEVNLTPSSFLQAMDVDVTAEQSSAMPHRSIPGYETLGLSSGIARLDTVADLGIKGVAIRVIDRAVSGREEWRGRQEVWAAALGKLAEEASSRSLSLIVDPFSAALQPSGQWGLLTGPDTSHRETVGLIEDLTQTIMATGAEGIVTLGRVPREVEVTRAVAGMSLRIFSFSTNSETSAAYAGNPAHVLTNQKILPGNMADMLVWTLLDVQRGTDVVVTKPIENYHSVVEGRRILGDASYRGDFVAAVLAEGLLAERVYEREGLEAILQDPDGFAQKAADARFGAYTVSGTTQLLGVFARSEGIAIARARLAEIWINAIAAGGTELTIIDRGASAYFSGSLLH